jgi:outer membrane receptor protein involved in Fe transport
MFVRNRFGEESNKDVKFTKSNHFVLGFEQLLNQVTKLKVEAYYQSITDVPVNSFNSSFSMMNIGADFVPSDESDLVNNGSGKNQGIELTLERYFNKGFYFLITASVFDSKYKGSDGIERNSAFNTQYAGNLLAGKEFKLGKKGTVIFGNIKLTRVGGRFFTPVDLEASKIADRLIFDKTKEFTLRQTDYFRVDLKIGYRMDFKKSSIEFAVDLLNVTNHQNIFAQGYNAKTNTVSYEYQQGFFPVPMFRMTF